MISIVIPAYREGDHVVRTIKEIDEVLRNLGEPGEIILVDDGSPDDTFVQAEKLKSQYPSLKVFKHAVNQGPGAAFRTGFQASTGDKVVTIDCDLSYNPKDIGHLIAPLSEYDVVIGAPRGTGGGYKNIPVLRIFLSRLAYVLDRMIMGGRLPSYSSFFVAYRGPLIRSLQFQGNGFDAQCEIDVRLSRQGARMTGIPALLAWRDKERKSSMKILREGKKRMKLWWRLNRLRKNID